MHSIGSRLIVIALVAAAAVTSTSADARHRKATHQTTSTGLPVDASGTPIIMEGYQADKGRVTGRVAAPVVVPPPHGGLPDLPPRQLLQPALPPPVSAARPQPTFSDKVTNCIHSYPLNAGIGNNPSERGAYMGQCLNQ
jgi:hypothetical protein